MPISYEKIALLSFPFFLALFLCLILVWWKQKVREKDFDKDIIDLSPWVNLPEKAYAEKVWSLLEEKAFVPIEEEIPADTTKEYPQKTEETPLLLNNELTGTTFQLCQPSVLHACFKKYIYNKESLLCCEENDAEGNIVMRPFEEPSLLQVWCKKYIYNSEYIFYYSENDVISDLQEPSEEPSLLQVWCKKYIYNPAYNELIRHETVKKAPQKNSSPTRLQNIASLRLEKKNYIRSNKYRYIEDETLYLSSLSNSPQEKIELQDEVNRLFSKYFEQIEASKEEETTVWGEPIPTF